LSRPFGRVEAHEEIVQGCLQKHLPNHVGEASGHNVFTEEPCEGGERCLGHPSEAVADPSLPLLRVPKDSTATRFRAGQPLALREEFLLTLMAGSMPRSSRNVKLNRESLGAVA